MRNESPPPLKGGPLGLGDPDDRRLRKTEKDVIIPKMIKEEAAKKCSKTLEMFLDCAKKSGLLFWHKCTAENDANNKCMAEWLNKPEFVSEITDKYLNARSHFRRTGEPLEKYERFKKKQWGTGFC